MQSDWAAGDHVNIALAAGKHSHRRKRKTIAGV